jgi:hypothetical protein
MIYYCLKHAPGKFNNKQMLAFSSSPNYAADFTKEAYEAIKQ